MYIIILLPYQLVPIFNVSLSLYAVLAVINVCIHISKQVDLPTPMIPRYSHSCVLFGVGSDFRVLVLFGGVTTNYRHVSETTLLLLSKQYYITLVIEHM